MLHIIEVTDLAAPELDVYARLTEAQLRNRLEPDKGVFIAESPKVIATALDAGYEPLSLLMERRHIEGDAQPILARCGGIPVYTAERETLARLTGFELTRGVLCAMRRPRLPSVEEVCARARRVAVLEGIVDHTNVGAIFRSASRARHRRGAGDADLLRPLLPPRGAREHGHGLSGAVGTHRRGRRRLAAKGRRASARARLPDRGDGADG